MSLKTRLYSPRLNVDKYSGSLGSCMSSSPVGEYVPFEWIPMYVCKCMLLKKARTSGDIY